MSSDEERYTSPIMPKDSDHGSSVSSDFQDEYEELLHYAVVTPKFGPDFLRQHQFSSEQTTSDRHSSSKEAEHDQTSGNKNFTPKEDFYEPSQMQIWTDSKNARTSKDNSLTAGVYQEAEQVLLPQSPFATGLEAFSPVHSENMSLHGSASSGSQAQDITVTELPVSTENMKQVENLLDLWSGNLKINVMAELSKWRLTIIEQHKSELKRQSEKHAEHITQLSNKVDNLQELLQNYEVSIKRKDEVISNLTHAIEKQKEKLELMRTFTHWRLQHTEARQEDYASQLADRHYRRVLIKNVWKAWHSVLESNWKAKVEQACRARAEEICIELSNDYEAKVAQLAGALGEARAEVQRLHEERGHFEGSMKKAFMRGVCALNMEAMTMFQGRESRAEHADPPQRRDDLGPSPSVTFQHQAATSQHDLTLQCPTSEQNCIAHFNVSSSTQSKEDVGTPVVISSTTSGSSILSTHKLPITRVVTSGQQKAGRTITARVTARSDLAQKTFKTGSNISSLGVSPPMASVVVEKHHPVTQQTISQAIAAKYPRSALQNSNSLSGRSTSQSGRTGVHSIKVVD
ncbi:centrosomal protein POC5 [Bombina bombina]|uniref:centrosomal protein POC5 n=1 Tax=Bombina bombina TaxID=8345 RepID=UPI00235AF16C|nr:centrosomal protein POC5 [Bombina bombina]